MIKGKNIKFDYDVLVVGGGPAGMMAALMAAQRNIRVVLVEKNKNLGVKLLMTGGGRCNLTNIQNSTADFLQAFDKNGKFLYKGLNTFDSSDVWNFFQQRGVQLKQEDSGRVFPVSNRADAIVMTLAQELQKNNVTLRLNTVVQQVVCDELGVMVLMGSDKSQESFLRVQKIILATGGMSYPQTGSNGDGWVWAQKLGHQIITPRPALTPVIISNSWVKDLEGLTVSGVKMEVLLNGKRQMAVYGDLLFTNNGVSGPMILNVSRQIGDLVKIGEVDLCLDLCLDCDKMRLGKIWSQEFTAYNGLLKTYLKKWLPKRMVGVYMKILNFTNNKKTQEVSRQERYNMIELIKNFKLSVCGVGGFDKAMVTTGGVCLQEVNPNTMQSRKQPNVYFAGEILDLDAKTGGYNLQACWTTGYVAGVNVLKHNNEI